MRIRPKIGITTYGAGETGRVNLPGEYVDAVFRAGGRPLLLPPVDLSAEESLADMHGLLLAGGGDLDPKLYGGKAHESNYGMDQPRDRYEQRLLRYALETQLPLFCICRGMQLLNISLGGSLVEHLPDEIGEEVIHRAPPRNPIAHPVRIRSGSLLADISGDIEVEPMSWHHQAIRDLGEGLEVVAEAADGVIEALEHPAHPQLIAVQWHPELTAAVDRSQQNLFDEFVRLAGARSCH